MQERTLIGGGFGLVLGGVLPVVVAVVLVPFRDEIINRNVALALMVVVVAAAAVGGRQAGAVAAFVPALAYDHTRPYLWSRITSRDDVETTVLLAAGRADRGHGGLASAAGPGIGGGRAQRDPPRPPVGRAGRDRRGPRRTWSWRPRRNSPRCWASLSAASEPRRTRSSLPASNTEGPETTNSRAAATGVELPPGGGESQVLCRGQPVGSFVLLPARRCSLSLDQRVVAVALADQVGAVLSAHQGQDRRDRSYG